MSQLDPKKLKSSAVYKHDGIFYALCADARRGRLYAGSYDYGIHVFDLSVDKKEPVACWKAHDNYVSSLAFVDRGGSPRVISASYDGKLIFWEGDSGKVLNTIDDAHRGWIREVVVFPGGDRVASVGDDLLVKVWDERSGKLLQVLEGHAQKTPQGHVTALYAVAVSPDGEVLASADRIGEVRIWESGSGKLLQTIQVPTLYTYDPVRRKRSTGGIRAVSFSPDGELVAVGGIGQVSNVDGLIGPAHVEMWSWREPRRVAVGNASGHKAILNDLVFHSEADWLVGAGGGADDGLIAFWDARPTSESDPETEKSDGDAKKPDPFRHKVKADGHVHCLELNEAASQLYAAGYGKLEVWEFQAAEEK